MKNKILILMLALIVTIQLISCVQEDYSEGGVSEEQNSQNSLGNNSSETDPLESSDTLPSMENEPKISQYSIADKLTTQIVAYSWQSFIKVINEGHINTNVAEIITELAKLSWNIEGYNLNRIVLSVREDNYWDFQVYWKHPDDALSLDAIFNYISYLPDSNFDYTHYVSNSQYELINEENNIYFKDDSDGPVPSHYYYCLFNDHLKSNTDFRLKYCETPSVCFNQLLNTLLEAKNILDSYGSND